MNKFKEVGNFKRIDINLIEQTRVDLDTSLPVELVNDIFCRFDRVDEYFKLPGLETYVVINRAGMLINTKTGKVFRHGNEHALISCLGGVQKQFPLQTVFYETFIADIPAGYRLFNRLSRPCLLPEQLYLVDCDPRVKENDTGFIGVYNNLFSKSAKPDDIRELVLNGVGVRLNALGDVWVSNKMVNKQFVDYSKVTLQRFNGRLVYSNCSNKLYFSYTELLYAMFVERDSQPDITPYFTNNNLPKVVHKNGNELDKRLENLYALPESKYDDLNIKYVGYYLLKRFKGQGMVDIYLPTYDNHYKLEVVVNKGIFDSVTIHHPEIAVMLIDDEISRNHIREIYLDKLLTFL